jgi:hypothetical protein
MARKLELKATFPERFEHAATLTAAGEFRQPAPAPYAAFWKYGFSPKIVARVITRRCGR